MKQVYRIDGDGFYLEPLVLHPELEERRELLPPLPVKEEDTEEPVEEPVEDTEEPVEEPSEELTLSRPSLNIIEDGEDRYYVYFEEVYHIPEDCVEEPPPSYFKPKWVTNKWVEAGTEPPAPETLPTVDEKVESLEQQVADLMFMIMTGGM